MSAKIRRKKSEKKADPAKQSLRQIYNYFFLMVFGLLASVNFLPFEPYKFFDQLLWNSSTILIGICLIGFFFFINRNRVSVVLSELSSPKDSLFGRDFLKVGIIVILALLVFSYRLDALDFWDDEYLALKSAEGYHQTGTYSSWDFIKDGPSQQTYTRAWPHTWLVAQSYCIFGVSEWSTRFVSVLCGCIFIGGSFFTAYFFSGNKLFSYMITAVFLLNPDFVYYWRLSRMYALLMVLFLFLPVFVFRAIEGKPVKEDSQNNSVLSMNRFFILNYPFLALSLFVVYWAYQVHITPLIIFPIAFFYVMLMALLTRERKYIGLTIFAVVTGGVGFVLLPQRILQDYASMMGLFESLNPLYYRLVVQMPFFPVINLILICGILFILPLVTNKIQQKKLLYCFSIVLTTVVFFVFMVDFHGQQHYRYICHIIPFAIIAICFIYFVIIKVYNNNFILIFGLLLMVASQGGPFLRGMKGLYYGSKNQPYPSIAYASIRENLKKGDVIFAQYLRDYYMKGIPENTRIINLGRVSQDPIGNIPYYFDQFFNDLTAYRHGWVVWQKYKEHHVDPKIAAYVKTLFKKYHGQGVDDSGVEVYYFDESMIKLPNFK